MKKSNVGGTKNDFTARSKEVVLGDAGCASAPLNKLDFETWRTVDRVSEKKSAGRKQTLKRG